MSDLYGRMRKASRRAGDACPARLMVAICSNGTDHDESSALHPVTGPRRRACSRQRDDEASARQQQGAHDGKKPSNRGDTPDR